MTPFYMGDEKEINYSFSFAYSRLNNTDQAFTKQKNGGGLGDWHGWY